MISELETSSHHHPCPCAHPAHLRSTSAALPSHSANALSCGERGVLSTPQPNKRSLEKEKISQRLLKGQEDPWILRFCVKTAAFLRILQEGALGSFLISIYCQCVMWSAGSHRRMTCFSPVVLQCASELLCLREDSLWTILQHALRCSPGSVSGLGSSFSNHRLKDLTVRGDRSAGAMQSILSSAVVL